MDSADLVAALKAIVGNANVLTDPKATEPYRTGFRCGGGKALAVVRPCSLLEQWRVLERCIAANKIIVMQAANTGLTGGSTPASELDDTGTSKIMRVGLRWFPQNYYPPTERPTDYKEFRKALGGSGEGS